MNQEIQEVTPVIRKATPAADRLLALDAVRGLAVIGMFIQHFALQPWSNFVSGNTMILFILCSGISYSMMAQGMWKRGTAEPVFRARVLARALFIGITGIRDAVSSGYAAGQAFNKIFNCDFCHCVFGLSACYAGRHELI